MPTDNELLSKILDELKRTHDDLSVMQQDINCIRNGEYDPPKGASYRSGPVRPAIDPDDEDVERSSTLKW